jgi:hypothetical protein
MITIIKFTNFYPLRIDVFIFFKSHVLLEQQLIMILFKLYSEVHVFNDKFSINMYIYAFRSEDLC